MANTTINVSVIFKDNLNEVIARVEKLKGYIDTFNKRKIPIIIDSSAIIAATRELEQLNKTISKLKGISNINIRTKVTQTTVTRTTQSRGGGTGQSDYFSQFFKTSNIANKGANLIERIGRFGLIDYPKKVFDVGKQYYQAVGSVVKNVFGTVFSTVSNMTQSLTSSVIPTFTKMGKQFFGTALNITGEFFQQFVNLFSTPMKGLSLFNRGLSELDKLFRHFSQAFYYTAMTLSYYSRLLFSAATIMVGVLSRLVQEMMKFVQVQYALTISAGILTSPNEIRTLEQAKGAPLEATDYSRISADRLDTLTRIAYQISSTTGMGFEETANLLYFVVSSGVKDTKELSTISELVSRFAFATDVSPVELFRSTLAITGAYGMNTDAETLNRVLGQLSYAIAEGVFTMEEFANQIQRVAAFAESANTPLEDTLAIMVGMSQAGLKSELIGTGLSQLMMQFSRLETLQKLGKYGIQSTVYTNGTFETQSLLTIINTLAETYGTENSAFWRSFADELNLEKRAQTALYTIINSLDSINAVVGQLSATNEAEAQALLKYSQSIIATADLSAKKQINRFESALSNLGTTLVSRITEAIFGSSKKIVTQLDEYGNEIQVETYDEEISPQIRIIREYLEKGISYIEKVTEMLSNQEVINVIIDLLINIGLLIYNLVKIALSLTVFSTIYRTLAAVFETIRPTSLLLVGFVKGFLTAIGEFENSNTSIGEIVADYVNVMLTVGEKLGSFVARLVKVFESSSNIFAPQEKMIRTVYTLTIGAGDVAAGVLDFVNKVKAELDKYRDELSTYLADIMLSGLSINMNISRLVLSIAESLSEAFRKSGAIANKITLAIPELVLAKKAGNYDKQKQSVKNQLVEQYRGLFVLPSGELDAERVKQIDTWIDSFVSFYEELGSAISNIVANIGIGSVDWANVALTFAIQFMRGVNEGLSRIIEYLKSGEGKEKLGYLESSISAYTTEVTKFAANLIHALIVLLPTVISGIAEGLRGANIPKLFEGIEEDWNALNATLQKELPSILASFIEIMIFGLRGYNDVLAILSDSIKKNASNLSQLFLEIGKMMLSQMAIGGQLFLGAAQGLAELATRLVSGSDKDAKAMWGTLQSSYQAAFKTIFSEAYTWLALGAELASSILKGVADGLSKASLDAAQQQTFKNALQNLIINAMRAAFQAASFLTTVGYEVARSIAIAMVALDKAFHNELKAQEYEFTFGKETFKVNFSNADVSAIKTTAENLKKTFETFLGTMPIGIEWITGFSTGVLESTANVLEVIGKTSADKLTGTYKTIYENIKKGVQNIGSIISSIALITLRLTIESITLNPLNPAVETSITNSLKNLFSDLWTTVFGAALLSKALGFSPLVGITIGLVVTLGLNMIRFGFDLVQAITDLFKMNSEGVAKAIPIPAVALRAGNKEEMEKIYGSNFKTFVEQNIKPVTSSKTVQGSDKLATIAKNLGIVENPKEFAFTNQIALLQFMEKLVTQVSNPKSNELTPKYVQEFVTTQLPALAGVVKSEEQARQLGETLSWILYIYGLILTQTKSAEEAAKEVADVYAEYESKISNLLKDPKLSAAYFSGMGQFATDARKAKLLPINFGQGYAEGGKTEAGNKYAIAGVVHAGEYVIPQWMVEKYPEIIAQIEGVRKRGYAEGGAVDTIIANTSTPAAVTQEANNLKETLDKFKEIINRLKTTADSIKADLDDIVTISESNMDGSKDEDTNEKISKLVGTLIDAITGFATDAFSLVPTMITSVDNILKEIDSIQSDIETIGQKFNEIGKKQNIITPEETQPAAAPQKGTTMDWVRALLDTTFGSGFTNSIEVSFLQGAKELSNVLSKKMDEMGLTELKNTITNVGQKAFDTVVTLAGAIPAGALVGVGKIEATKEPLSSAGMLTDIAINLGNVFKKIAGPFSSIINGVLGGLGELITSFDSVSQILEPISTVLKVVGEILEPFVDAALQPFLDILTMLGQIIGYALIPYISLFGTLLQLLLPIILPFLDSLRIIGRVVYIVGAGLQYLAVQFYNFIAIMYNTLAGVIETLTFGFIQLSEMALKQSESWDEILAESENLFSSTTVGSGTGGVGVTSKAENINYTVYADVNFQDMVIADKEELKQLILDALKDLDIQLGQ